MQSIERTMESGSTSPNTEGMLAIKISEGKGGSQQTILPNVFTKW